MAINMKDLNKLARFARKNGITNLKIEGIELQLHPSFLTETVSQSKDTQDAEIAPISQYTDEQLLNWSSTSYVGDN